MTRHNHRNWHEFIDHYRVTLIYIAVVVTIGLVLQAWEVARTS